MAQDNINRYELLVIGGSAGSLEVILDILPVIRTDIGLAVVLVLHRKHADSVLTRLLADKTPMEVKEAEEKEPIVPGVVYLAPADYHLLIEKDRTFSLDFSEKLHYSRPSIDATFETAAEAYGPALICLLLSGANADGTEGLKVVQAEGGRVWVQDPNDASVSYMPQQAVDNLAVDRVLTNEEMAVAINELNGEN